MRMSSGARLVVAILIASVLVCIVPVGLVTAAVIQDGFARVHVTESSGSDVAIVVPAGLIDVALWFVPPGSMAEASRELEPFLPALEALREELDRCPDAVFVEVRDGDERVRVEKRDGRFLVHVESGHERVHIAVPARTVSNVLRAVSRAA